jgi:hypothetical protein
MFSHCLLWLWIILALFCFHFPFVRFATSTVIVDHPIAALPVRKTTSELNLSTSLKLLWRFSLATLISPKPIFRFAVLTLHVPGANDE